MMKMVDTLMVLLFPFLDCIPFTLPRYWLFRDRLRIPFRYIVLIQIALAAVYSGVFYQINLGGLEAAARWTTITRYCFLLLFLVLAFLLIKDSFPKLMFTWLLFLAWQFFVLGNANFIESRFFWDFSGLHPYLVYNIARVVIYLITFPFMFLFFSRTVAEALNINDGAMWRHFWKIPLFPTLFGMLYCFTDDVYAYATWEFMVSRYLMLLGACYVSYVALKVLEISRSRTQLEETLKYADRSLLTQKKQFDTLAAHMDDTRRARHDLRQHLTVVQSYLDQDDKRGLTVLLGNLLENAVEACKRDAADRPFIKLRVKQRGQSMLLVLIDNTCLTPVVFENGTPLSAKREGMGIGTASVREIAGRYNGSVLFEQRDGVFYASVRLMLPEV